MGRRKITIRQIVDPKLRHITFNKRKNGLIKKAAELSLLCNVNMLLIFEDGNGNLIQFSKNKLNSIPGFFQECRYNNLLEFVAKDYPTFFKVNHYKKHKEREADAEDFDDDDDDFGLNGEEEITKPTYGQSTRKAVKRNGPVNHIKEEDHDDSPKIIYQSEDSVHDDIDQVSLYSETQPSHFMQKNQMIAKPKPTVFRNEDKFPKNMLNKEDMTNSLINEQEIPTHSKEAFQPYREVNQRPLREEKPVEYPQPYLGFEQSFKRPMPTNEPQNSQFRFYSGENANLNANLNAVNATNPFVNAQTYPNPLPYINNHAYPTAPNNFQAAKPNNRLRGFGNLNMSHMANEETLNAMLKGFNPLNFAMGGGNPFIPKTNAKPEMDEKMLDTANMIKYLNGANANTFTNQKMYNFHPAEVAKPEEAEVLNQVNFDGEHEYHELPPYVRGEYRIDPNNMPTNLPSAYFGSKKFNFDGYFNTFEDDRFNEFADSKRKMKQGQ